MASHQYNSSRYSITTCSSFTPLKLAHQINFTAAQLSQRKLEELESLISTENICRDIALSGCICDPKSQLTVTPFSIGTSLSGFFLVEWPENKQISKEAMEVVTLYSALSSLYFTHSKFFALDHENFDQGSTNAPTMSQRQIQILQGMVEGKTNHELAQILDFLSPQFATKRWQSLKHSVSQIEKKQPKLQKNGAHLNKKLTSHCFLRLTMTTNDHKSRSDFRDSISR
jgi:hypothetical protein